MKLQKKTLLKIHFALATLLLINYACRLNFDTSLQSNITFILKIAFYISGLILFFKTVKPYQKISIYFSLYVLSPILIFIGWIIDGIFGAILGSIFLFFFAPNENLYQIEDIKIYRKFSGFLGRCCDYEFVKEKGFTFERKVAELNFENVDFRKVDMKIKNDTLFMHFVLKEYDGEGYDFPKDTIIKLSVK